MSPELTAIWTTIERELGTHAPSILPTLNPPASDNEIAGLEARLGYPIPDDLRESLRIHDGQDDPRGLAVFCAAGTLLPVEAMLETWARITEIDRQLAEEIPDRAGEWWDPAYLPLSDFAGDRLCVNLDPEARGEIVWHVHDCGIEHGLFESYTTWLRSVAEALAERRFSQEDGYLNFWGDPNTQDK